MRITMIRRRAWYYSAIVLIAFVHFGLCYRAMVARDSARSAPIWLYFAPGLAFFLVGIASIFDDLNSEPRARLNSLALFAIWATWLVSLIELNSQSTPSIGHLAGIFGLIRYGFLISLFYTVFYSLISVPFVICWDSIARAIWDRLRHFQS